eukprot:4889706-Pleurochrysis_carterae.AAC.1
MDNWVTFQAGVKGLSAKASGARAAIVASLFSLATPSADQPRAILACKRSGRVILPLGAFFGAIHR